MPSPCPKCGGIKIEPADPGLLYWLAEVFGYRLRVCGRCRGYRLLRAQGRKRSHSSHHRQGAESAPETGAAAAGNPPVTGSEAAVNAESPTEQPGPNGEPRQTCPWCGSKDYGRSHRTWWERRRGSAPMYRCRRCDHRFARVDA